MTPWAARNERINHVHRAWVAYELALRYGLPARELRQALLAAMRAAEESG